MSGVPVSVIEARAAHARGDAARMLELVEQYPLELWYSMSPGELQTMLLAVPREAFASSPSAEIFRRMFSRTPVDGQIANEPQLRAVMEADPDTRSWLVFAAAAEARVRGDAASAWERVQSLLGRQGAPVTHVIDATRGAHTFFVIQAALTAALAGRAVDALALYERSLLQAVPFGLEWFVREAHVRSAVLLALYGRREAARARLERSRAVRRTTSWVEPLLDADAELAETLLAPLEHAEAAAERVLTFSLDQMGEMWPLYAAAIQRVTAPTSRRAEGRARIERMRTAGLGGPGATGIVGSVIPLTLAIDDLLTGNMVRARSELNMADPDLWQTKITAALHAVLTGAPARAKQLLAAMRPDTQGLTQVEGRRIAVSVMAALATGDEATLRDGLAWLAPVITAHEYVLLRAFAPGALEYAVEHIPGWPAHLDLAVEAAGLLDRPALTERELDVLAGLARGMSRQDVARHLFLSPNTVKTHQSSLYRKLGVSDAGAAVREAARLGLV